MVRSPCATFSERTTDKFRAVGLAMLDYTPVMVDILDSGSALDSDANFTGQKRRVAKVNAVESRPDHPLTNVAATVTDQCRSSRRNLLHWAQLH